MPLAAVAAPPSHVWDRVARAPPRAGKSCSLAKTETQKLRKSANHLPQNPETATQHLKVGEAMLGEQVAGSPWLNTRRLQKDLTDIRLLPSTKQKSKHPGKTGEKLRRGSNPGLLSEGRGAACQKC